MGKFFLSKRDLRLYRLLLIIRGGEGGEELLTTLYASESLMVDCKR